jgi:ribose transport system permease protein
MRSRLLIARYPREIALLAMAVCFSLTVRQFASPGNVTNVLMQLAPILLITIGQSFALLTGGIDLSQGAAVGLYSVILVWLMPHLGIPAALLVVMGLASAYGMLTGYLVTGPKGGVNPLVVTLAAMYAINGVTMYSTGGTPLTVRDAALNTTFASVGGGTLLQLPVPFLIAVLIGICAFVLLHRTNIGLIIYAAGNNPTAARVHGVSVLSARCWAYGTCAVLTSLGSFLLSARIYQGNPHLGEGLLFDSIGGSVLGGVALSGGVGGIWAAFRGALLVALIQNALYLTDLNSYIRDIAVGILIFFGYLVSQKYRGGRVQ